MKDEASPLAVTIRAFNTLRDEGLIRDYAIGGAVGAYFYIESAFTEDVDFFVILPESGSVLIDINPIYQRLLRLGGTVHGEHIRIDSKLVQILVPPSDLEDEAVRSAVIMDVSGLPVKVFRAEYLAAIYVRLLRPKDIGKISELTKSPEFEQDRFMELVSRYELKDRWNQFQRMNI